MIKRAGYLILVTPFIEFDGLDMNLIDFNSATSLENKEVHEADHYDLEVWTMREDGDYKECIENVMGMSYEEVCKSIPHHLANLGYTQIRFNV